MNIRKKTTYKQNAIFIGTVLILIGSITACSTDNSTSDTTAQPNKQVKVVAPTIQPTKKVVRVTPTSNPVCNVNTTNTPCVQFASVQDAAVGESSIGAIVHIGTSDGVTWVREI